MNPDLDTVGKLALGGLIVLTAILAMVLLTVREMWRWFRGHFSGFDDLAAKRDGGKVRLSGVLVDAARVTEKRRSPTRAAPSPELLKHLAEGIEDARAGRTVSRGSFSQEQTMGDAALDPAIPGESKSWGWGRVAMVAMIGMGAVAWVASVVVNR